MEGVIVNFRRARHHQKTNHIIIHVESITTRKDAEKLLNKEVAWKSPSGKTIKGVIKSLHGNSGCVRAVMEKGIPGQAIGKKIKIGD